MIACILPISRSEPRRSKSRFLPARTLRNQRRNNEASRLHWIFWSCSSLNQMRSSGICCAPISISEFICCWSLRNSQAKSPHSVPRPKKRGRKHGDQLKWDQESVAMAFSTGLRSHQRRTIGAISASIGIPASTIHRLYRMDKIIHHVTNGDYAQH